jgi:hypothetical protein
MMALRAGLRWVSLRFPIRASSGARAARKDRMDKELLEKVKGLARDVLLNSKAQIEWINSVDTDILNALTAFARQFIEPDENTTKMDAFRLGIMLGGMYERSRQKDRIEKAVKGE